MPFQTAFFLLVVVENVLRNVFTYRQASTPSPVTPLNVHRERIKPSPSSSPSTTRRARLEERVVALARRSRRESGGSRGCPWSLLAMVESEGSGRRRSPRREMRRGEGGKKTNDQLLLDVPRSSARFSLR
jgi:hypothetical protein